MSYENSWENLTSQLPLGHMKLKSPRFTEVIKYVLTWQGHVESNHDLKFWRLLY